MDSRPGVVLLVTPEPSVVNDSWGPIVPPAGPWGVHTPKPANRIPSPPRNQAESRGSRILSRCGRIDRRSARLVGRIGMPAHDEEQDEEADPVAKRPMPTPVQP